jgi:hypothetical protein
MRQNAAFAEGQKATSRCSVSGIEMGL